MDEIAERPHPASAFAAGAIIVAVPFMIFFLLTQRSLITSLPTGALTE